jgi:hypothetical protein
MDRGGTALCYRGWSGVGGSTLISVTCSRPAGRIQGTVTVEAFPVIDTPIGLQGACPAIDALALQVVTIFEAFRLTFPNARD